MKRVVTWRNRRIAEFADIDRTATYAATRWTELSDDPNAPAAIHHRAQALRAAFRPPIGDRADFLVARCRGKRVLDIGCVAHSIERMTQPNWLHARIADASSTCLGVDIIPDGVAEMKRLGFDAIVHDLSVGPGPLKQSEPFDRIVAGELIEHVGSLDMLFDTARALLANDGELLVTTPNPYAPARVHAGQRGMVWENVDHVAYAFPSGIAELAERHGLVLNEAMTTSPPPSVSLQVRVRRWLRGTTWLRVGYVTQEQPFRAERVGTWWPFTTRAPFVGETFVYVVGRPHSQGDGSTRHK